MCYIGIHRIEERQVGQKEAGEDQYTKRLQVSKNLERIKTSEDIPAEDACMQIEDPR